MLLFLVRHARSATAKGYWQSPDSQLGKRGKEQARVLSSKTRFNDVDQIFSSSWNRSKETAEIISDELEGEIKILDFIHEREQSSDIYGSSRDSKISKAYAKEYSKNYKNLDWKFADDEESIREVLSRVSEFQSFLIKNYKKRKVLVVSHDIFIRCFLGIAMLGEDYSDKAMVKILGSLSVFYTGISLLKYSYRQKRWRVFYVNDFSHFKKLG